MNTTEKILIVDDAIDTLEVMRRNLVHVGYDVQVTNSVDSGINLIKSYDPDLVITDLKMPRVSGLDLIKYIKENYPNIETIMITGYPTIDNAVKAVKLGADSFLAKPFTDCELLDSVAAAMVKVRLHKTMQCMPKSFQGLIGQSKAMVKVFRFIEVASATSATVLINGESGTGKELVARAIHYNSSRVTAPFVPVNCGAIPEELIESELFGHKRGAFTGAIETRPGFFQTADGGTIFLDEISETSASMQVKLLRAIQEKEIYMVGHNRSQKVDVRIVAGTNKDLRSLVAKDNFREDLFYRLNVISVDLPPLRERDADILLLTKYFLEKYAKEYSKPLLTLSADVMEILQKYRWPGNVRELENLMLMLVVMVKGDLVQVSDLPKHLHCAIPTDYNWNISLIEAERSHIVSVLARVGGNKTKAAEILGIDRKTLRTKLQDIDG